jgi:hypothetical protein
MKNFKDPNLNTECMKKDQFCYLCCDKEVGVSNRDNLNCCYKRCESAAMNQNKCGGFYQAFHITQIAGIGAGIAVTNAGMNAIAIQTPIVSQIPFKPMAITTNLAPKPNTLDLSPYGAVPMPANDYKVENKIKGLTGYEAV